MPSTPFFKDFGKTGKEFFTKGFPNNLELTAESTIAKNDDVVTTQKTKINRNDAGEISGSINPKWSFKSQGVTLSTTIHSNKKLEIEASLADKGVKGLKSILKIVAPQFDNIGKDRDAQQVRGEFEYAQESVAVAFGVDVLNAKPTASLSAVTSRSAWAVGAEAAYSLGAAPDLQSLAVAVGYTGVGWAATLARKAAEGATQKVTYSANVHQKVDENLEFGIDVAHAVADKAPVLQFGGKFGSGAANVKAKIGTNGRIGVAYTQDVNYFTSVTLGADVSSLDSKDHKLGLAINIKDK